MLLMELFGQILIEEEKPATPAEKKPEKKADKKTPAQERGTKKAAKKTASEDRGKKRESTIKKEKKKVKAKKAKKVQKIRTFSVFFKIMIYSYTSRWMNFIIQGFIHSRFFNSSTFNSFRSNLPQDYYRLKQ